MNKAAGAKKHVSGHTCDSALDDELEVPHTVQCRDRCSCATCTQPSSCQQSACAGSKPA